MYFADLKRLTGKKGKYCEIGALSLCLGHQHLVAPEVTTLNFNLMWFCFCYFYHLNQLWMYQDWYYTSVSLSHFMCMSKNMVNPLLSGESLTYFKFLGNISLLTSKFETSKNSNKILFKLLKLEIIDYNYSKLGLGSVCFVHLWTLKV